MLVSRRLFAATVLTLAVMFGSSPAVSAAPDISPGVQEQIKRHLAEFPGGVQTGPAEITYGDGRFVITFASEGAGIQGVPDCPGGWFCFYDRINYGYPRGKLSDCGRQDLAEWGWRDRTESAHYNMSRGSVAFIADITWWGELFLFSVGVGNRTSPDAGGYRNMADIVYRYC